MHTPPPDTLPLTLLWTVVILPRSLYYREMSRQKTSFHLMKSNNLLHLRQEHVSCIWHAGQSIALFFLFPISLSYCLCLPELSQSLMFFLGTTHPQNKGDNKIYAAPYHPPNKYRQVMQSLNGCLFARTAALGRNGLAGFRSKLQNRTYIFFFLHSDAFCFDVREACGFTGYDCKNRYSQRTNESYQSFKCHGACKIKNQLSCNLKLKLWEDWPNHCLGAPFKQTESIF